MFESRFIRRDDPHTDRFVFRLPYAWWSRGYEYAWAGAFAQEGQVVLDAACGIEHPLKFFLADQGCVTHACDLDDRITTFDTVARAVTDTSNLELDPRYAETIDYQQASLTDLPYQDAMFDAVFCISTLEHLRDRFKRGPVLRVLRPLLRPLIARAMDQGFAEFARVLKPGGLAVLTFDYPRVHLDYVRLLAREHGLSFAGEFNGALPDDAIADAAKELTCFRAVLRKTARRARQLPR